MKIEETKNYGQATVGFGTPLEHKLDIIEFISADYIGHRLISVVKLEDESFILSVENPASSGRNTQQSMRLGKESTIGLISTLLLYINKTEGEDGFQKLLQEISIKGEVNYSMSDNLKKDDNE